MAKRLGSGGASGRDRDAPTVLAASAEPALKSIIELCAPLVRSRAAVLLRQTQRGLHPVASRGLRRDAPGRRLSVDHPWFAATTTARVPVWFDADAPTASPLSGLVLGDPIAAPSLYVALRVREVVLGYLVFEGIEDAQGAAVISRRATSLGSVATAVLHLDAPMDQGIEATPGVAGGVGTVIATDSLTVSSDHFVGVSGQVEALRRDIATVAPTTIPVLVSGETGTGKELVARMIHANSDRARRPLVYLNCAALPENLAESELFGHVRGAFTGAGDMRSGRFELADGGTLFLDEVGELPLALQPKLLRALQFGEVQRVGADRTKRVDVRVIAATNRDLASEIRAGRFRADLYHRLAGFPLHVAPLHERREDIALLLGHAADQACRQLGVGEIRFTEGAVVAATAYDWPGNVRELEHVVLRAALRASARCRTCVVLVTEEMLGVAPTAIAAAGPPTTFDELTLQDAVELFKRELVARRLDAHAHNWSATARSLGVDRGNFYRFARRLGFERD